MNSRNQSAKADASMGDRGSHSRDSTACLQKQITGFPLASYCLTPLIHVERKSLHRHRQAYGSACLYGPRSTCTSPSASPAALCRGHFLPPAAVAADGRLPSWWCALAAASTYALKASRRLWCCLLNSPCIFMNATCDNPQPAGRQSHA